MPPETETTETQVRPAHGAPAPNDSLKTKTNEEVVTEEVIIEEVPSATTVFKLGNKVFSSAEEASKYVASLEESKLKEVTAPLLPTVSNAPPKQMIDGKPIDEMLFENPTRVVEHITQAAVAAVDAQKAKQEAKTALWNKFYQRNPDLRGKDRIVNSVLAENLKEWNKLSEEDCMKIMAQTARNELRAMGVDPGKVIDLPPANPATLSGNRGEGGQTRTDSTVKKATTFTEEILATRAKRSAAAAKRR